MELKNRLQRWRQDAAKRLPDVSLDPPGRFIDDPSDDLNVVGETRGALNVPDGTEL